MKNLTATQPALNVGQPLVHLNGVSLVGDDGPVLVVFGSSLPSSSKKTSQRDRSDKTFWIRIWPYYIKLGQGKTRIII